MYKHLDFECEKKIANDIKSTIFDNIFYCDSSIAKEYETSKMKINTSKWSRKSHLKKFAYK